MKIFRPLYKTKLRFVSSIAILVLICLCSASSFAQNCPPNIDFETGTFNGWTCYTGSTAEVGGENVISLSVSGPVSNRHTMYTSGSNELDAYGGFPVSCPNGSGHSIRLGNDEPGTEAEGVSAKDVTALIRRCVHRRSPPFK